MSEMREEGNGAGSLRYLALGDSYTIGEGVPPGERWPVLLAEDLISKGYGMTGPEIVARTGWTTEELMAGVEEIRPEGPFDIVSLMIGVNDQYRGYEPGYFLKGFRSCLAMAVELAGGDRSKVMTVSIPDWGVTPFAAGRDTGLIAGEIDRFNDLSCRECLDAGIVWVDITQLSRALGAEEGMLAPDGLHPSGLMYASWTPLLSAAASMILDMHK